MSYILSALASVFSPMGLLMNLVGVVLGIIFGALPGLNGVVGVALRMVGCQTYILIQIN